MKKLAITLGLAMIGLALSGCIVTPWSERLVNRETPDVAVEVTKVEENEPAVTDPRVLAIQEVLADLEEFGTLDRATQASLKADLSDVPPSMWPGYITQVRAMIAYRKKGNEPTDKDSPEEDESPSPPSMTSLGKKETITRKAEFRDSPIQRKPPGRILPPPSFLDRTPDRQERVAPSSYTTAPVATASWQAHVADAARELEAKLEKTQDDSSEGAPSEEVLSEHARLRLLYLLAGRRDEAFRSMDLVDPALAEFWSNELFGLDTWLDTEAIPDASDRAARAKESFDLAAARLGAAAPLVVHELAFCTKINSFGDIVRFDTYDFVPGQEVLVYAEVDNFTIESTVDGYRTSLAISYQILDSEGRVVGNHDFAPSEDSCGSARRDFYVMCRFQMPERIYDGEHTLKLSLEDHGGNKLGDSSITFRIVGLPGKRPKYGL